MLVSCQFFFLGGGEGGILGILRVFFDALAPARWGQRIPWACMSLVYAVAVNMRQERRC